MLRHMLFYRRVLIPLGAVFLGLWLGCFLPALPLSAAQLWEEGSGAATGAPSVQPMFVELAKQLKPAVVNISSKQAEEKMARGRSLETPPLQFRGGMNATARPPIGKKVLETRSPLSPKDLFPARCDFAKRIYPALRSLCNHRPSASTDCHSACSASLRRRS